MSQTARVNARFDTGSHQFWRAHLAYLLAEGGAERPRFIADLLLAAMTAEQVAYWVHREGYSPQRTAEALADAGVDLVPHEAAKRSGDDRCWP